MSTSLAFLCFCLFAAAYGEDPTYERIEYNDTYETNQHIDEALNYTGTFWLSNRNYNSSGKCIYAKRNASDTNLFDMGFRVNNHSYDYQAYVNLTMSNQSRTHPNVMEVKRNKSSSNPGHLYTLIYSSGGYNILRVNDQLKKNGSGCEVYVREDNITHPAPPNVQTIYKRACGTDNITVYDDTCTHSTTASN